MGLVKLCEIESEPLVGAILDDLNVGGNDDVASTRVGIVFEVWSLVVDWIVELNIKSPEELDRGSNGLSSEVWLEFFEEGEGE